MVAAFARCVGVSNKPLRETDSDGFGTTILAVGCSLGILGHKHTANLALLTKCCLRYRSHDLLLSTRGADNLQHRGKRGGWTFIYGMTD